MHHELLDVALEAYHNMPPLVKLQCNGDPACGYVGAKEVVCNRTDFDKWLRAKAAWESNPDHVDHFADLLVEVRYTTGSFGHMRIGCSFTRWQEA